MIKDGEYVPDCIFCGTELPEKRIDILNNICDECYTKQAKAAISFHEACIKDIKNEIGDN